MRSRLAYVGVLLLVIGAFLYFYSNYLSTNLVKEGSVYLLPGSKQEIPISFSLYYFGSYPSVPLSVIGGEVLNVTQGVLPINGTYVEVNAYLIKTLGTESSVVIVNNYSYPITVYYGIRDIGYNGVMADLFNVLGIAFVVFGLAIVALYLALRRYKWSEE